MANDEYTITREEYLRQQEAEKAKETVIATPHTEHVEKMG